MNTLRWRFTDIVALPAEETLLNLRALLAARWAGRATTEPLNDGLAVAGDWWYRGEYHVHALADNESRIVYEVHNVADGLTRWIVPLVTHGDHERQQCEFRHLVTELTGEPDR